MCILTIRSKYNADAYAIRHILASIKHGMVIKKILKTQYFYVTKVDVIFLSKNIFSWHEHCNNQKQQREGLEQNYVRCLFCSISHNIIVIKNYIFRLPQRRKLKHFSVNDDLGLNSLSSYPLSVLRQQICFL